MEITGIIKVLNETQNIGINNFRKRDVVITTIEEQYPQDILIEFIQNKCALLDTYKVGQKVKIDINIKGREWTSPEGIVKYFHAIIGWKIELLHSLEYKYITPSIIEFMNFLENDQDDDSPFK